LMDQFFNTLCQALHGIGRGSSIGWILSAD
jgi:hypothetical protein